MNPESSPDQAAEWAARLDAGPLNRDEAEALTRWLDADPANEGRLEEMQTLHRKVRLVLPGMTAAGRLPGSRHAPGLRPALAWAGAIAAVLAIGFWLTLRPVTYSTAAAQRQKVVLADGTQAELNARTTLEVQLGRSERRLRLEEGEVFLKVAKDPARPFIVETAAGRIRVTGTVFNVSSHSRDSLGVLLLEGAVEATPTGGEMRRLAPGDEWTVTASGVELHRLDAAARADATAWREGRIVFHQTRLAQVMERFAYHHARRIEVAPEVRDLQLGGSFRLDDLEEFLRDLAVVLPVLVRHEANGVILVGPIPAEGK